MPLPLPYEAALADARHQASVVLAETNREIEAVIAKRSQAFADELAAKIAGAEARIAAARDEVSAQIRVIATEASMDVTQRLIGIELDRDTAERAVDARIGGGR